MRILLYTGKGGVGKTSVAAATALRCAQLGHRTIVTSTDTAHSLGDALERELGPEPQPISANLWAQEVDVYHSLEKHWGTFQRAMAALMTRRGVDEISAEDVTVIPGLEEGAGLLWINEFVEQKQYDVVVIDAAPTAETLRLLSLPDTSRWWFEHLFPVSRGAARLLRPIARPFGTQLPDESTFEAVDRLFEDLKQVQLKLTDPALTSVRLVVNAERMVIRETQRLYTYLNLYGYTTDAVICNRLIPDEVRDPYFAGWKEAQAQNLKLIEAAFAPLPILTAPLFRREAGGADLLQTLAERLFGVRDPSERWFVGRTHSIETTPQGYVLVVPLPFATKGDVELVQKLDELTLRVGAYQRNFVLPRALQGLDARGAEFRNGALHIHFARTSG
jgi:arsenite-transporting ATPase